MQEEILRLKCAKKWAGVVRQEALLEEYEKAIEEFTKKKDDAICKTQNSATDMQKLNDTLAQINGSIDALIQSSNENRQRYDAQRVSHREKTERSAERLRDVKRIEGKKERIVRDIQKLEERLMNNDTK